MVLQNDKCTAVVFLDEKFVLGCEDEPGDMVFNPQNIKRNEPHDALKITAKTKDTLSIDVVVRHDADAEYSAMLSGEELTVTYDKNAFTFDLKTGELIRYQKDAFDEDFDISELNKLLV